jgi:hypothetical protein
MGPHLGEADVRQAVVAIGPSNFYQLESRY